MSLLYLLLLNKLRQFKKSDIYLDSLTTFNSKSNTDTNSMGFLVKFNPNCVVGVSRKDLFL